MFQIGGRIPRLLQERHIRLALPRHLDQLAPRLPALGDIPAHDPDHSAMPRCAVAGAQYAPPELAERCFRQIEGFGDYGFPESHAASFALLAYASSWLKCHHPDAFACALLNAQPMGFYAPAQIVRDAREHGVEVRPVDINASGWDNSLEDAGEGYCALRLGMRQVGSLRQEDAARIVDARRGPYPDVGALARHAGIPVSAIETLAAADAFRSAGLDRRQALWQARALAKAPPLPLFEAVDRHQHRRRRAARQRLQARVPHSEGAGAERPRLEKPSSPHPVPFPAAPATWCRKAPGNPVVKSNNPMISVAYGTLWHPGAAPSSLWRSVTR